mmetsp:Transcript_8826/g.7803  ORF Transcript_8826/g.7803 Transcript_8826/m.7803 type:complete len:117 (+) Transcript_8826:967-1317(+)
MKANLLKYGINFDEVRTCTADEVMNKLNKWTNAKTYSKIPNLCIGVIKECQDQKKDVAEKKAFLNKLGLKLQSLKKTVPSAVFFVNFCAKHPVQDKSENGSQKLNPNESKSMAFIF